jgi:hypothetical protein
MTSNLPPLSHFVQVFDDTLVKSVHQRHVAGITLTLPGGNQPEALAAVTAILDALEQALRVHTVSMILITASILVNNNSKLNCFFSLRLTNNMFNFI